MSLDDIPGRLTDGVLPRCSAHIPPARVFAESADKSHRKNAG